MKIWYIKFCDKLGWIFSGLFCIINVPFTKGDTINSRRDYEITDLDYCIIFTDTVFPALILIPSPLGVECKKEKTAEYQIYREFVNIKIYTERKSQDREW